MTRENNDDTTFKENILDVISRIGLRKSDTKEVQTVAECLRAVEALSPVTTISKTDWIPLPEEPQEESESKRYAELAKSYSQGLRTGITYGDIYEEFCKKFPNVEVEDYRPAVKLHIPQLARDIPNAIVLWLKDGSEIIYIAEMGA